MLFRNEYYYLSNMYPCVLKLRIHGKPYIFKSAESAFQSMKNPSRISEFVELNGYDAKKLGKRVNIRPDWNDVKDTMMLNILRAKFMQNPDLQKRLMLSTYEIVEDNSWGDTYWGVCNGTGQNKLGVILMQVREELRKQLLV